jgi:hypothetical protein
MKRSRERQNVENLPRSWGRRNPGRFALNPVRPGLEKRSWLFYLWYGLKVTKIHQVVEYTPATCFQKFGDNISDARLIYYCIVQRNFTHLILPVYSWANGIQGETTRIPSPPTSR